MLYRILMRLAALIVVIEVVLLAGAIAMGPPSDLHLPDAVGLVILLGPPALIAGVAWVFKPRA